MAYNFNLDIPNMTNKQLTNIIDSNDKEHTEELLFFGNQKGMARRRMKRVYKKNRTEVHLLVVLCRMARRTQAGLELIHRASAHNLSVFKYLESYGNDEVHDSTDYQMHLEHITGNDDSSSPVMVSDVTLDANNSSAPTQGDQSEIATMYQSTEEQEEYDLGSPPSSPDAHYVMSVEECIDHYNLSVPNPPPSNHIMQPDASHSPDKVYDGSDDTCTPQIVNNVSLTTPLHQQDNLAQIPTKYVNHASVSTSDKAHKSQRYQFEGFMSSFSNYERDRKRLNDLIRVLSINKSISSRTTGQALKIIMRETSRRTLSEGSDDELKALLKDINQRLKRRRSKRGGYRQHIKDTRVKKKLSRSQKRKIRKNNADRKIKYGYDS